MNELKGQSLSEDLEYFNMCSNERYHGSDIPFSSNAKESRVLVLYTGGTIGMIDEKSQKHVRYLSGQKPAAPGLFGKEVRSFRDLHDQEYADNHFGKDSPFYVLPKSPEKYRVVYVIEEFDPLLDSSNMGVQDWKKMAKRIEANYQKYDGFVILHGTDTLAYTASALSFMLENLGKTIIITGAQISIFGSRSDGRANFTASLILAGNFYIPEVTVLFQDKLLRGNCSCKISSNKFHAFESPKYSPLAEIGISINVNWGKIFRPFGIKKFHVHKNLNTHVELLRIHPNIHVDVVRASLHPPIQGVVLETYGAGNIQTNRKDIIDEIRSAVQAGVIIVNISQCTDGIVETIYETGQILSDIGVISGRDMTAEAAYTKLCYVLSKDEWSPKKKKELICNSDFVLQMMSKNIRGEMSEIIKTDELDLLVAISQKLGRTSAKDVNDLKQWLEPFLLSHAVLKNDVNSLCKLREAQCNLSVTNSDGRTPLHIACSVGNVEIVRYLLKYGANVHIKDNFNRTPLFDAIQSGHFEIIQLLIECGANINYNPNMLSESLGFAASNGHLDVIKSFEIAGANLDAPDKSGRTPLHLACLHNHPKTVQYLLEHGCQLDKADQLGITPVHVIEKLKLIEIIEIINSVLD